MKKICKEFWETVNPTYACINELVILPESGDCGFVDEIISSHKDSR